MFIWLKLMATETLDYLIKIGYGNKFPFQFSSLITISSLIKYEFFLNTATS